MKGVHELVTLEHSPYLFGGLQDDFDIFRSVEPLRFRRMHP